VVVGAAAQWDSAMVRDVFRVAIDSARRRGMRAVMFVGDGFQFEWGDWNPRFAPSEETIMGAWRRTG
jgi:class 3 adenylate cyclase